MALKFNRNLQLGYGFSILILVAVGALSYITLQNLIASSKAVEHSNLVIQKLENSISVMKDAETGQRGFLLTGQRSFLEPYNGAYEKAIALVAEVKSLTRDNRGQQKNMNELQAILLNRLDILKQILNNREQGKAVTAADLVEGKQAMDALRQIIDKAEKQERVLLDARLAVLNRFALVTPLIILVSVLAAVGIALFSYIKVIRDVREKDRLRDELEIKEEETATFNEELTAANEEIMAANEELTTINDELFQTQEELAQLNLSLEEKIKIRTKALMDSEADAQALNEELNAMNEELSAANEEIMATNEELRASREETQKSEALFKSIALNIPNSLIIVMGMDHRFIAVEGDLIERTGYKSRDYIGKHPLEVWPQERYTASKDLYDRMFAGEQFTIERKAASGDDLKVDFVPLRNEKGQVYAGLIIALDITDIKKAEERSAKLAAIVESSEDAIIGKTLEGIITSWNHSAERIFGYTESEMIGESILKLLPEERKDEEPKIIARIKKGERVAHFETRRVTSEGVELDVSLTVSPIRDSQGNITGVSKTVRDISEKKQDELRKNDFIGMVSHELKTPLTSLTALIQVLKQKLQSTEDSFVPTALEKANIQVKKMGTMVNGFLNISRLESGKIMIDKQLFDLKELVAEVVKEMELTISTHKIIFDRGEELMVNADRDKIGSVISNLISNAIKYSPRGMLIIVECNVVGDYAQISVNDQGIGIAGQDLERLFERYYRVNNISTRHISGFGIGLYLSAEITQRHNGSIWVESALGVGSTFYFTLPLN